MCLVTFSMNKSLFVIRRDHSKLFIRFSVNALFYWSMAVVPQHQQLLLLNFPNLCARQFFFKLRFNLSNLEKVANRMFFSITTRKTCNVSRLLRGYWYSLETKKKYQNFSMCIFNVIHDLIFLNRPIFAVVRELSASLVLSCWRITLLRTVGRFENQGGGE